MRDDNDNDNNHNHNDRPDVTNFKGDSLDMFNKAFLVAAVLMAAPAAAFAQAVTNTSNGVGGAAAGPTRTNITLTGVVESSVMLTITGTFASSTSLTNASPSTATVNFGTFSTSTPTTATANVKNRSGALPMAQGAFVGTNLSARLTFSGATSGTITLERLASAGAAPDVPAGNLKYGSGIATVWDDNANDGTAVPNPATTPISVCGGNCTNALDYAHQLVVFVPDTQTAGTFTTVVTYVGTAI